MEKSLKITKQLISLPSYLSSTTDESRVAEYLISLLKDCGFTLQKQYITEKRWNLTATIGTPKLWLCGHIDTIEPKNPSRLIPEIVGDRFYGLGALDMKAGIAAIISAAITAKKKNNLGLLFYCDEEYAFKGMQRFLEDFIEKPKLTVIAEPTNLQISNAHRGILEPYIILKGKSGHASRPEEGVNAISQSVLLIEKLKEILKRDYSDPLTGISACTLSKIIGGTQLMQNEGTITYAKGTNSIPDTAELWLDIRPASPKLNGRKIKQLIRKLAKEFGLESEEFVISQDFGPLLTKPETVKKLRKVVEDVTGTASFLPSQKMGYGDGQLFFAKTKTPVVYFGPGPTEMCHKDGEYVSIKDLIATEKIFRKLIEEFSKE